MSEHSTGPGHARRNGTELTEPHRRYNPLTDEWLLVSSNRTSRPWLGLAESAPDSRRPRYDAACYLCPGNVRANGERNPDYGSTFVFRNDYAALQPDSHIVRVDKGLLRAETARGTCMVLCFSPRHDVTLAGMDDDDVRRVVDLWASQSAELGSRFPWVQVFENRGAAMGASNPHPHGQIWAGEALPREAVREDATQRRHFELTGNRLLLDYVAQERGGPRDIGSNDEWLLVVPYWATWPHETLLVPRRRVSRLPELDGAQRDRLASSMGDLLRGYDRLFNVPFPYSMGWHQAPFDGEDRSHWQLHAHFYPPLLQATVRKFMVGYELLSEPQRDISPEDAPNDSSRLSKPPNQAALWRGAEGTRKEPMSGAATDNVDDRSSAESSAKAPAAAIVERAAKLRQLLSDRTGEAKPALIVRAPGRVNLIGEYTDFNLGFVLPAAIDLEVWIALVPWDRPQVELTSVEMDETMSFSLEGLVKPNSRERTWIDYVAATAWAMSDAGLPIRGFRGVLNSTVPVGSGLSSSAAVEMASSWALADAAGPRPEPAIMAAIAQRGENAYVGVNCGIMDQFASAAGKSGHALLIDCRANTATSAPLPGHLSLVVCDTAAPRRLNSSAYNTRRQECETGVRLIAEREPDVRSLRDITPAMLARNRDRLPEVVARRCEHIVNEDDRVIEAVEALAADDIDTVSRLFAASHKSLRDLFEVSSADLDVMVEIAQKVPGVVASRLTGAGFGGCTINLVERGAEDELRSVVADEYPRRTGLKPRVYVVQAVDGAGPLEES